MNKVIMIGNLVADPEARTTQSGKSVATFRIGVRRNFSNAQGVYESDFFSCQAWGNTAEYVRKYMAKGSRVAVEGRLQNRSYDAQDGSKRYVTEIICDRVEGLQSRTEAQPQGSQEFTEIDDEGLPF